MDSDETQIDMQFNSPDETGNVFSHHGAAMRPLSEEKAIRSEADMVVSSIPLLDEPHEQLNTKTSSAVYGVSGVQQSDVSTMSAEDVRDNNF